MLWSFPAFSIEQFERSVTGQAVACEIIVSLAELINRMAGILGQVESVEAFNAVAGEVIRVAVLHLFLLLHLGNLTRTLENAISRVAWDAGLGFLFEVCTLWVDSDALTSLKVTACPALHALTHAIEFGTAARWGWYLALSIWVEIEPGIAAGAVPVDGVIGIAVDTDRFA